MFTITCNLGNNLQWSSMQMINYARSAKLYLSEIFYLEANLSIITVPHCTFQCVVISCNMYNTVTLTVQYVHHSVCSHLLYYSPINLPRTLQSQCWVVFGHTCIHMDHSCTSWMWAIYFLKDIFLLSWLRYLCLIVHYKQCLFLFYRNCLCRLINRSSCFIAVHKESIGYSAVLKKFMSNEKEWMKSTIKRILIGARLVHISTL